MTRPPDSMPTLPSDKPVVSPRRPAFGAFHRSGIFAVLLVIASLAIGYLLTDVRHKLNELDSSPNDNVQWTLAQLEVEFLEFTRTVEAARAVLDLAEQSDTGEVTGSPFRPDTPGMDAIRQSYDILYSRVLTLQESPAYREVFDVPALRDRYAMFSTGILALAPVIDQTDVALSASLDDLLEATETYRPLARVIMTEGNRALAFIADETRNDIARVLIRLAVAVTFLLVILGALAIMFRRMASLSEARLKDNLATSARLEAIFSTSYDGIAVIDANGRLVTLNRAGIGMFGRDGLEPRGLRIGTLLARRAGDALTPLTGRDLFEMANADRKTGIRLIGLHRNTGEFPVEISVDVTTRDRSPICVCVIRDIVHQTAAEADLKDSRDKARAGERAKARFLGVVSHEMRTPLNGILGSIDLIDEDLKRGPQALGDITDIYLPVVRASSETLLRLVNDVLDITQIEGGMRLLASRPFDLDAMLSELATAEQARARDLGNALRITSPDPVGMVRGDPDRLRQILVNLLANAVKFTRDGRITLTARRLDPRQVEVRISDTGFGISPQDLDRVFEDFVRTDNAIEHQIQGTGLGLGIARALVEAMNGTIDVVSEIGEGSEFCVVLPLPATALTPDDDPAQHGTPALTAADILLVEDNATNRFIARRLLEIDGHRVVEAEDGAAGLAAAKSDKFDLILMDISMPLMDGLAAARSIRDDPGPNQRTRIVALTAHMPDGLDQSQDLSVMDAILHKPLDRCLLRHQIARSQGRADTHIAVGETAAALDTLTSLVDAETARRLIDALITEADTQFPALLALAADNRNETEPTLAQGLHALGGAFASFGALEMHELLLNAETEERAARRSRTRDLLAEASALWPVLRAEIRAEFPETTKSPDPDAKP
ncbi:ATP-binding protein [Pseudooceanicola sp.]|uniref:ATP-binding protein n=1 Tax=Pseudooceanicola sp. TaxID=1914328 RepID=UPI0040581352